MIITFPWPPKELNPNVKSHWAVKNRIVQKFKSECYLLCREVNFKHGSHKFAITFAPPMNRKRDVDNVIASCKTLVDALALASKLDDSKFQIKWPLEFAPVCTGGAIIVEVLE